MSRYRKYSEFLRERYGEKVYKLPVALPVTCPNRDGNVGRGGCTFCGEIGAGYENLPASMTVNEQLNKNIAHIAPKYKAYRYIPYYQNFSNTYLEPSRFKGYMEDGCIDSAVGLALATRPDCINESYLEILREIKEKHNKDIYIELGLQSVNYKSLRRINRGHTLAEYIEAVQTIKKYGFEVCTHMILNLPWDEMDDVIEGAKILSAVGTDQVKLHALYIIKNTEMAAAYLRNEFTMIPVEEYVARVTTFLQYLSPQIVMQRLVGRAPETNTLFTNWSMGWWRIQDLIDAKMENENIVQGQLCDYLQGKAVRKFINV